MEEAGEETTQCGAITAEANFQSRRFFVHVPSLKCLHCNLLARLINLSRVTWVKLQRITENTYQFVLHSYVAMLDQTLRINLMERDGYLVPRVVLRSSQGTLAMGIERNHIILNQSANEYPSMEISKKKKEIKKKKEEKKGERKNTPGPLRSSDVD